ncbi:ribonuclease HIII [Acholeplasma sp. OttesenSCG-928-E16]|nr:ribonuclease HIII [Acholeplasma sp. OttesenSCG-928-E16]
MKYHTLTLNEQRLSQLEKIYSNHLIDIQNEHLLFSAIHNGIRIFAYKTGKVVLQGDNVLSEVAQIKSILKIEDYAAIGADEVGTGDVFGPIVVCSVYTSLEDLAFLEELGVKDSKNMDDRQIKAIGPKLANRLIYSLIILDPTRYNEINRKGNNLNKIKALLHNSSIIKTTAKINKKVPVILDQFCKPELYFGYLKDEKFKYTQIEFHVRAESYHLSVAAASILARYAFLAKMHELGKKIDMKLLKGAASNVDEQIMEIYTQHGIEMLEQVAKMNYKNVTKQVSL